MNVADLDDVVPDKVRDCAEIARRSLALFGVVGIALGAPRRDIVEWLKEEDLWNELSPNELAFVSAEKPSDKQMIDASWDSEALIVLLWALQKVEELPEPNDQCDTSVFQELLPPFADMPAAEFIASAVCRSETALLDKADELKQLHWQARDARVGSQSLPTPVDIEIIQERHHAINWVIGYDGAPWDEVTTDT